MPGTCSPRRPRPARRRPRPAPRRRPLGRAPRRPRRWPGLPPRRRRRPRRRPRGCRPRRPPPRRRRPPPPWRPPPRPRRRRAAPRPRSPRASHPAPPARRTPTAARRAAAGRVGGRSAGRALPRRVAPAGEGAFYRTTGRVARCSGMRRPWRRRWGSAGREDARGRSSRSTSASRLSTAGPSSSSASATFTRCSSRTPSPPRATSISRSRHGIAATRTRCRSAASRRTPRSRTSPASWPGATRWPCASRRRRAGAGSWSARWCASSRPARSSRRRASSRARRACSRRWPPRAIASASPPSTSRPAPSAPARCAAGSSRATSSSAWRRGSCSSRRTCRPRPWGLDRTATPMGARRLREWLLSPLLEPAAIGRRLDAVEELTERVELREALRAALEGIGDLERLAGRIGARSAGPRDVAHVAVALGRVAEVRAALAGARAELLGALAEALDQLPEVAAAIAATLVDAPPPHTRLPGFIRPGCDREVDELRETARDARGWLARFEASERQRTRIASLKVRHNKVFGYYVEVTRPNLPLVPSDYERRQTLVGAERFVTPTLREHEARVLGAEERLRALEIHLFEALLDTAAAHHPTLARTADALATLDALASLAEVAHRRGYVRPAITRAPTLTIRAGRHPVVEAVAGGGFVPNDARLDPEAEQLLVITGPNMGGKSTYLRQVALITLLAQMGSFVPAAEAEIGLVDRIFTRVGASDNLVGGESTFMVEMRETANILSGLTPRSLVILDEIGRGTSTFDGISIAWAVAEHLHDAPEQPRALFATHYPELTALAAEKPRVRNLSVAVAEWKGEIVFLRQIVPGPAPRSYGVEVARLAGVPEPVVARARTLLAGLETGRGPVGRGPEPPAAQLSLFTPTEEQLRRELAVLDPERLTPIEALAVLARLVAAARRE